MLLQSLHTKFMWFYCSCVEEKKMLKLKRAKCAIQTNTNSSVFTSSFGPFTEPKPTSIQLFKQNLEHKHVFASKNNEHRRKKKKNPPLRAFVLWHGSIFAYASSALTPCQLLNWIFNVNFLTSILPVQQTHWLDLLIVDTRD